MMRTNESVQILTLLSGKGGSGKTVIALSMGKILSESGYKVLLVDCDMSTHGASYFFEAEFERISKNAVSLEKLMLNQEAQEEPLLTKAGFYFIPSTLSPVDIQKLSVEHSDNNFADIAFLHLDKIIHQYDFVILDCQAGFSQLATRAVKMADRNLIVLEADAISASAIRILFLQIGSDLEKNTWQIFNKLTENERQLYEKIFGGTLFTNLPPISFDGDVRLAFAKGELPGFVKQYSAFGLGVLRIMKVLFPSATESLKKLEETTVGKWYEIIQEKIDDLDEKRRNVKYGRIEKSRIIRLESTRLRLYIAASFFIIASLIFITDIATQGTVSNLLSNTFTSNMLGLSGLIIAMTILIFAYSSYLQTVKGVEEEKSQDIEQENLYKLEIELEKYKTLTATDPTLKEYEKNKITS